MMMIRWRVSLLHIFIKSELTPTQGAPRPAPQLYQVEAIYLFLISIHSFVVRMK